MGKLHKIRRAYEALSDEQKRNGYRYGAATVKDGVVQWVEQFYSSSRGCPLPHAQYITKLRYEHTGSISKHG